MVDIKATPTIPITPGRSSSRPTTPGRVVVAAPAVHSDTDNNGGIDSSLAPSEHCSMNDEENKVKVV